MRKSIKAFLSLVASIIICVSFYGTNAFALGECGLSCCIAGATGSGATLAENFGATIVYEYSWMETLRHGSDEVSPNQAIDENRTPGMAYSVPTEMTMEKKTFVGVFPINERLSLLTLIPYATNEMEMRMKSGMGMVMDMEMDRICEIGDVSLLGLYTAYTDAPIRPTRKLTLGFGLKIPTGDNDERSASGSLVHAMMQPGSGSWDLILLANYMRAFYSALPRPLVLQANLYHQLTTEGRGGYEFGDQTTVDLITRYQAADYVNLGVEVNYIHAESDDDHDGRFDRSTTSMLDNTDNTGLDSVFISPSVQVKLPGTPGSFELKYQTPLYQHVKGYQLVVDWRVLATAFFAF